MQSGFMVEDKEVKMQKWIFPGKLTRFLKMVQVSFYDLSPRQQPPRLLCAQLDGRVAHSMRTTFLRCCPCGGFPLPPTG